MRYRLLLLSLLVSGVAYAQSTPPVADDDTFNAPTDTLTVEAPGVLANDSDADGDSLIAVLVAGPSNGMLTLNRDGSFTYTPNAGFTGADSFTYLAEEAAAEQFVVDSTQSGVLFTAELRSPIGSDTDQDSSAVVGAITADVRPNTAPFADIHVGAMDLTLADAMSLSFGFGLLGGLDAEPDPDSVRLVLARPGAPAPVIDSLFTQTDNEVGIFGTLNLDASGLLSTAIADGPQALNAIALGDLTGAITQRDMTLHLTLPVAFAGTFEIAGNTVVVTVEGLVVADAPILPPPQMSNVATVTLDVGGVGTGAEVAVEVPLSFTLEQNYPNPFNPTTTIAYALPAASEVSLTVYDVLGGAVATLVDARQPAGRHEVAFDASPLPSGIYVYRLQAGSFSVAKRLVVLK
ncbi:MAG: cadherin-like domain-containing protein [Bacteroidetes bacterium]|nr:cadherin-like domain-containing protein [Bacteroidota bacterium]